MPRLEPQFVNSDVLKMAEEMIKQAHAIRDEEPRAGLRRTHLYRASAFLLQAMAELEQISA